jgi:hypothetical protein
VMAFLGATCLLAACLRATHRQALRLAQAGRIRFDLQGFGPGGDPLGRSKAESDRGRGQVPACASHAERPCGGQILWKIKGRRLEAKRNGITPLINYPWRDSKAPGREARGGKAGAASGSISVCLSPGICHARRHLSRLKVRRAAGLWPVYIFEKKRRDKARDS